MDIKQIEPEDVDWIKLARDEARSKLQVAKKGENLLTS